MSLSLSHSQNQIPQQHKSPGTLCRRRSGPGPIESHHTWVPLTVPIEKQTKNSVLVNLLEIVRQFQKYKS